MLSGKDFKVERIGFAGGEAYSDFEHIPKPIPLSIKSGQIYEFTIRIDEKTIEIEVDRILQQTIKRPTEVCGRVGLRPWRSKMDITNFIVNENKEAEQND